MKTGQRTGDRHPRLPVAALLAVIFAQAAAFDDPDTGWTPGTFQEPEPWRELDSELPDWPREEDLLEVGSGGSGVPYRVYVDPASLTAGEDQIVRYTVVIVSPAGVRNVFYEGLHCGEKAYRRYAYGLDGEWRELGDADWHTLDSNGMFAYRRSFYFDYMCNPSGPYLQAEEIIHKLRSRRMVIGD